MELAMEFHQYHQWIPQHGNKWKPQVIWISTVKWSWNSIVTISGFHNSTAGGNHKPIVD
jgi:hypothetical protein